MTRKPIPNVAIIGAGLRGSIFARSIEQNPLAKLAAICDLSEPARARLASIVRVPSYSSVEDLLANHPEIDAGIIATPDFSHTSAALACLAHGLDLLIEKPLATTSDEAYAISESALKLGRRVMIGFENRWQSRFLAIKRELSGEEGNAVIVQTLTLNDTRYVPQEMLSWSSHSTPAWFLMPHTLDLAMWLSGAHPVAVDAFGTKKFLKSQGLDTYDAISAMFTMSDGSFTVLNSSWCLPASMPHIVEFTYEAQTRDILLRADIDSDGITAYTNNDSKYVMALPRSIGGVLVGRQVEMTDDFIRYISDEPDIDVPTIEAGVAVTHALDALHRSLHEARRVTID